MTLQEHTFKIVNEIVARGSTSVGSRSNFKKIAALNILTV